MFSPVHDAIVVVLAGDGGLGTADDQTDSQDRPPHDWIPTPTATRQPAPLQKQNNSSWDNICF